jgi:hypothetical protein
LKKIVTVEMMEMGEIKNNECLTFLFGWAVRGRSWLITVGSFVAQGIP